MKDYIVTVEFRAYGRDAETTVEVTAPTEDRAKQLAEAMVRDNMFVCATTTEEMEDE